MKLILTSLILFISGYLFANALDKQFIIDYAQANNIKPENITITNKEDCKYYFDGEYGLCIK